MKQKLLRALIALGVLFVLIQFIPFGRNHTNPPVQAEPQWDSPQTRALAKRACFDCHSNETRWPWYSNIAPVSWLVYLDTINGRNHLNFSEWNTQRGDLQEAIEAIQEGEMPPFYYAIMHAEARLSAAEKQALIEGLRNTH